MKRLEPAAFAGAILLFVLAGFTPRGRAEAQLPYNCPGGTTLLCGTDTRRDCIEIDRRTNECTKWREQTLYYYYGPNGGGGSCGDRICQN